MVPKPAYTCINCASEVKELYKKYSPTVLKLATCSRCNEIADKYIEYDPVIIIIDLVLLNREAYRHVLFNTNYSFYWKMLIILELMEAYWELSIYHKSSSNVNEDAKKPVLLDKFYTGDIEFYKTFLKVILRNLCFFLMVLILTLLKRCLEGRKDSLKDTIIGILKCLTISSFGIFLFLPSLIWDKFGVEEYHFIFVLLYMTLTQLVAYTVFCSCSKLWSIFVIISAYIVKLTAFNTLDIHL